MKKEQVIILNQMITRPKSIKIEGIKIIGMIGSRSRNEVKDFDLIQAKFFEIYKPGDIICTGGCNKGGDAFALRIAKVFCFPYLIFPADWNKFGVESAGLIRNTDIALWSSVLIALVANDRKGGTEDTIDKFVHQYKKKEIYIL